MILSRELKLVSEILTLLLLPLKLQLDQLARPAGSEVGNNTERGAYIISIHQ